VSRLILLLVLAVWLIGADAVDQPVFRHPLILPVFLGGYFLLVAGFAIWGQVLSRRMLRTNSAAGYGRFIKGMQIARWMIPAWLLAGLFAGAAWHQLVIRLTGTSWQLPGTLVGTLPAYLAWIGLWWAEYPVDRALRHQNALSELYSDLPVHPMPRLARYLSLLFRQQLLPMVLPVLLILLIRDLIMHFFAPGFSEAWDEGIMLAAMVAVYIASPIVLRWVFNTRPLEDSPLRQRLQRLCNRMGLRYRDILLWQTDCTIANACVFGIFPGFRYVLLSDRLIETMTDEQIEAVFAHEIGHMVHHHMLWFMVFFAVLTLAALGPGRLLDSWISSLLPEALMRGFWEQARHWTGTILVFGAMLTMLGILSRRFERQADVFAARMIDGQDDSAGGGASHVGKRGADLFIAALERVAVVNNIPLAAKDWFHPSIARRILHLREMSADPARTTHFDRTMKRLYTGMVAALVTFGAIAALTRSL